MTSLLNVRDFKSDVFKYWPMKSDHFKPKYFFSCDHVAYDTCPYVLFYNNESNIDNIIIPAESKPSGSKTAPERRKVEHLFLDGINY